MHVHNTDISILSCTDDEKKKRQISEMDASIDSDELIFPLVNLVGRT